MYFSSYIYLLYESSLCNPVWPGIYCVNQVGLQLRDLRFSCFCLPSAVQATTPWFIVVTVVVLGGIHMCICMSVYMSATCVLVPQRLEAVSDSSEVELGESCKLPNMGTGAKLGSGKNHMCSSPPGYLSSCPDFCFWGKISCEPGYPWTGLTKHLRTTLNLGIFCQTHNSRPVSWHHGHQWVGVGVLDPELHVCLARKLPKDPNL